ncbi:MAG: hypothetical protein Q8S20_03915 [Sulfuritalea sp.]|nr:hypothetical protein [Sulfuritalea sp.]
MAIVFMVVLLGMVIVQPLDKGLMELRSLRGGALPVGALPNMTYPASMARVGGGAAILADQQDFICGSLE